MILVCVFHIFIINNVSENNMYLIITSVIVSEIIIFPNVCVPRSNHFTLMIFAFACRRDLC